MTAYRTCFVLLCFAVFGSSCAFPQTQPNLENGFKPYGSYHGSDIDTVNVMNGNLQVHIPLPFNYPQRGSINRNFVLQSSSKNWMVGGTVATGFYWSLRSPSIALIAPGDLIIHRVWVSDQPPAGMISINAYGYWIESGDGASHTLAGDSGTIDVNGEPTSFDASDTTGLHLDLSNPDANSIPQTAVVRDRKGNVYQFGGFTQIKCSRAPMADPGAMPYHGSSSTNFNSDVVTVCNQTARLSSITDPNGNVVTGGSSVDASGNFIPGAATDTLGRTSFAGSGSTTDYTGCGSATVSAWLYGFTAFGGAADQLKLCQSNLAIATNFNATVSSGAQIAEQSGTFAFTTTLILPDQSAYTFGYDNYGLITNMGLPTGGSISYTWMTLALAPCNGPPVSRAVATRTINDGQGHLSTWTYHYGSMANGIQTNVVTDPAGNDTVHVFTALDGTSPSGAGGCQPYETSTKYYQGSSANGQLLKQVDTHYLSTVVGVDSNGGSAYSVVPTSVQTTIFPGSKVSLVTKSYDAAQSGTGVIFGNVVVEKEYDWGPGTLGALLRETDTTYQWQVDNRYLTAHMLDLPAAVTVKDGAGCAVAATDYTYDEASYLTNANISTQHVGAPNGVRGNLTTVTHWAIPLGTGNCNPRSGTPIVTHTNWFDTGEIYKSLDARNNPTTHSYSSAFAGAYPTQSCDALNHCVSANYDFYTGVLTSFTDQNGNSSSYSYDYMWRLTSANFPDGGQTTFSYPSLTEIDRSTKINASMNKQSTVLFDGLGRVNTAYQVTPNGNATVNTIYDALGRVALVTNPYFTTGDQIYGTTQTQYDALGRVTQIIRQDNSIATVSYSGNCVTNTDEAGKQRKSCSDALGRLTTVWEDPAGLNYETDYQYDGLGNLVRVDQKGSAPGDSTQWRTRTFTYDSAARLLTATNPESGAITYSYDAAGNMLTKTDARGVTVAYSYDALDRLTAKSYSDGSPGPTYTYDTNPATGSTSNGIGRLTHFSNNVNADASFWYDPMGRVTYQTGWIPSNPGVNSNPISAFYDFEGNLTTLVYPDGERVDWTVDSGDRMRTAADNFNGISFVADASYLANGAQYQLWRPYVYQRANLNNRLQPDKFYADNGLVDGFYQSKSYSYGAQNNGDLLSIINYKDASRTQTFGYDSLDRLTHAENAGNDCTQTLLNGHSEYWGNNYVYDAWGNLLQKNVSKCAAENLQVNPKPSNQLWGYPYDAAGNMLNDWLGHSFAYDAEGRLASVNGGSATYTYGGDGERIRKDGPAGWTEYIYFGGHVVAERSATGWTNYVFFNGKRVARRDASGAVHYYISDHLGSTTMVVSSSGAIENESEFYPWGGELQFSASADNHYKFTGKERDPETGLDYFGARFYANALGRWVSADWSATPVPVPYADFGDPQTLNLYGYVRNLPTTKVDGDGHDFKEYVLGVINSLSNNFAGTERIESNNADLNKGQKVGDVISLVVGTVGAVNAALVDAAVDVGTDGAALVVSPVQAAAVLIPANGAISAAKHLFSKSTNQGRGSGTIYKVPGSGTPSGKPYIGRHNQPNPAKTRRSPDGRDRKQAKVVDKYNAKNVQQGRVKEQQHIDKNGGINNLDNKRDEIAKDKDGKN